MYLTKFRPIFYTNVKRNFFFLGLAKHRCVKCTGRIRPGISQTSSLQAVQQLCPQMCSCFKKFIY